MFRGSERLRGSIRLSMSSHWLQERINFGVRALRQTVRGRCPITVRHPRCSIHLHCGPRSHTHTQRSWTMAQVGVSLNHSTYLYRLSLFNQRGALHSLALQLQHIIPGKSWLKKNFLPFILLNGHLSAINYSLGQSQFDSFWQDDFPLIVQQVASRPEKCSSPISGEN